MRVNTCITALGIVSAAVLLLQAQNSTPNKGKDVVDHALAALGGERFVHMRTRVSAGRIYSFFHDEMSAFDVTRIYTEYSETPRGKDLSIREREVLGKKQDYSYLFLNDQGWDITFRGARPVEQEVWDRYRRTTENDILYLIKVRLNEPGMAFDYVGSEVHLSTHVEVVDITDAQDQTIRVSFDHNTGLPVRETFTWMDPETKYKNEEITEYDKYRDAGGGIMWPFTIERSRNGYKTYQMFANLVEANGTLPKNIFELPPGAKVLRKSD